MKKPKRFLVIIVSIIIGLLVLAVLYFFVLNNVIRPQWRTNIAKCMPADTKLSDITGYHLYGEISAGKPINVEERLWGVKAKCTADNKLVDSSGKQIVLYHLTTCWDNPPINYNELLQKQLDEISRLEEQNRVIQIFCNPNGMRFYWPTNTP